jgi:hypothetical protein
LVPTIEAVDVGDVVVFDRVTQGYASLALIPGDTALLGVVVENFANEAGEATVAHGGIVTCKVDAGYGAIRAGDLLTTSPTPGHAMVAVNPLPGTVLGKAFEPLETGAGTIRVIVTLR